MYPDLTRFVLGTILTSKIPPVLPIIFIEEVNVRAVYDAITPEVKINGSLPVP
jgi:hypothetical protein